MAIDTTQTGKAQGAGGGFQVGFASVEREYPEPVDLWVEGALPNWVEGSVVRTGPARFEVGARAMRHWFDGLPLHDRLRPGEPLPAVPAPRWLLDPRALRVRNESQAVVYAQLRAHPSVRDPHRAAAAGEPADAAAERPPVHRELPLAARPRYAVPRLRPGRRPARGHLRGGAVLRLPPRERLRARRRAGRRPVRIRRRRNRPGVLPRAAAERPGAAGRALPSLSHRPGRRPPGGARVRARGAVRAQPDRLPAAQRPRLPVRVG